MSSVSRRNARPTTTGDPRLYLFLAADALAEELPATIASYPTNLVPAGAARGGELTPTVPSDDTSVHSSESGLRRVPAQGANIRDRCQPRPAAVPRCA